MALAITAATACAGGSGEPQPDEPNSQQGQAFDPGSQNMSAMPPVNSAPQPTSGRTPDAVISVAEHFAVGYSEFSPFAFDPAEEWFDRWSTYAAPAFLGRMQLNVNQLWSWTWNDGVKAFDARIDSKSSARIEGEAATVRVAVNRLLLGMNETGDKSREQTITYNVFCDLAQPMAAIVGVDETTPGTPLPAPANASGR